MIHRTILQQTKVLFFPYTLYLPVVKCISIRRSFSVKSEKLDSNWIPIYKLPVIRWAVALNKIKIYQAGLTAIAIPSVYALQLMAPIPDGTFAVVSALGLTGTMTLFLSSLLIKNLIGFIYMDSTKTHFRIAYVDFWGKRRNVELRHDEIDPPCETLKFGFISNVTTRQKESYKLLRRLGEVSDPNLFSYFFGE